MNKKKELNFNKQEINQISLDIMLVEYKALKDEEKTIFSFEFTVLSIWITILGVLLSIFFTNFKELKEQNFLIIFVAFLIPAISSLFGIVWLDLVARFIKLAHYIYLLEEKITRLSGDNSMNYEHYIYNWSLNKSFLKRTNMILYYLITGAISVIPFVLMIIVCLYYKEFGLSKTTLSNGIRLLYLFQIIVVYFVVIYVKEILSYKNKTIKKIKRNKNKKLFILAYIISIILGCFMIPYIIQNSLNLIFAILSEFFK